jgi:hypothetical protein
MLPLKGSRDIKVELLNLRGFRKYNAGKLHWPVRLQRASTADSLWLSEANAPLSTKHFAQRLVASGGQL